MANGGMIVGGTQMGHPHIEAKNHASKGMAKSMALGGGGRFSALKSTLAKKPGITNPGALAAKIGRDKYGSKKMAKMASAGRKKGE